LEKAENHRKEWTHVDIDVLADPQLNNFQKALKLKRTYSAVLNAVHKNGFTSEREPMPDPKNGQWHLFWEFEELEVVA
jgi:hypothetical protein